MAETILLVDDDSNILEGYRRSLGREFRLETALGGVQALELATEHGPYAVVVSDMRMPVMDGIQLLSEIKALVTRHHPRHAYRQHRDGNGHRRYQRRQHFPLSHQALQPGSDGADPYCRAAAVSIGDR